MATAKRGILSRSPQWWRHLRPWWRWRFWKVERRAARADAARQAQD